jgi:hypothetical protein
MFKIFAPSYKRPKGKSTHLIIPEVTYVVSESEKESYINSGEHDKFWFVPSTAQGNLCRIRNYILDNSDCKKILLLDDDHTRIGMWSGNKRIILSENQIMEFIHNSFNMADDYNIKFWGILPNNDKLSYRESAPFSLSSYIGGPWQAFNDCDLRYDEKLPLKEDYDMTLQILNKYRRALRINYIHYFPKQHNNTGGCAIYRNIEFEKQQMKDLKKKWGSKIVKSGALGKTSAMGSKTKENMYDINPIIKSPLKGI